MFSFLFLIASYSVSAQSNANKFDDERFEKNIKIDIKKIKLSSAEVVSFKEITKKYLIKYDELMETAVSDSQRTQKIKEIQEQKDA